MNDEEISAPTPGRGNFYSDDDSHWRLDDADLKTLDAVFREWRATRLKWPNT
jgi:hypothetical protein